MSEENTQIASSLNAAGTSTVSVDVLVSSETDALKAYLVRFCTERKLFAKIQRVAIGLTQITVQCKEREIELALKFLQAFLKLRYEVEMLWGEITIAEEQDKFFSITIEDAEFKLENAPPSGRLLELGETPLGGSAETEELIKIIMQSVMTGFFAFVRDMRSIEKHIFLIFQGQKRALEVSTILTMEYLIDRVNGKFGTPTVPIKSLYRKVKGQVEPVIEVKDLQDGFLYYALKVNEQLPGTQNISWESFYKSLKKDEDMSDEQISKVKTIFADQAISLKQLMKTGELAMTDN